MKVLALGSTDLAPLVEMKEALGFAEKAYTLQRSVRKGSVKSGFAPLVAYAVQTPSGAPAFVDYRSGYVSEIPITISTMGFGYPENRVRHGLPGVFAVSLLSSIETGAPLAIMEADHLVSIRTGAAGAVASKYLARKDSRNIAFIGAGHLARNMLDAHIQQAFPLERIRVWSRSLETRQAFAGEAKAKYGIETTAVDTSSEAVLDSDIICCCSLSQEPVVMMSDLKEGAHINAFGADASGKQELDTRILRNAKIVVDDLEQCSIAGEIHKALKSGVISKDNVYAEIGEIVSGEKSGRQTEEEITVMDSTGLAVQDIVIFHQAYNRALSKSVGTWIEL